MGQLMVALLTYYAVVTMYDFATIDIFDKDQKYFFAVKKQAHYIAIFIILKSMNIFATDFAYNIFQFTFVF